MHVVISGYYGFDNVGDEAILFSIIQALRNEQPNIDVTVLSNNPEKTAKTYDVNAVNRWSMGDVRAALKNSDGLISGGGSLLQDQTGIRSIPYYAGIIKLAQWMKKPTFVYAQGMGPFNRSISRWIVKHVLNRVDQITVRDEGSKTLLQEVGVKRNIKIVPDPVLGLDVSGFRNDWVVKSVFAGGVAGSDSVGVADETSTERLNATSSADVTRAADQAGAADSGQSVARGSVDKASALSDQSNGSEDRVGVTGVDRSGTTTGSVAEGGAPESLQSPTTGLDRLNAEEAQAAPSPTNGEALVKADTFKKLNDQDPSPASPNEFISVSVRDWPTETAYLEKIADGLDRLAQLGYAIVFVPMHGEYDEDTSNKTATLMKEKSYVAPGDLSIEEKVSVIGESKLLIGMRLHSLVFAAANHVPFIALSYDPKIDAFASICKQPVVGHVAEDNWSSEDLFAQSKRALEFHAIQQDIVKNKADQLKEQARQTAELALQTFK